MNGIVVISIILVIVTGIDDSLSPERWQFFSFWGGVFLGIFMIRRKIIAWQKKPKADDPETILKSRFAKGELSKEEYQDKMKELKS